MIIGVGSINPAKVAACKAVVMRLNHRLPDLSDITFVQKNIRSGVPDMPLSQEEMLQGAYNRAVYLFRLLQNSAKTPAYTIGPEGGVFYRKIRQQKYYFLQSWVYVYNGDKGYWGSSGAVPLPEKISSAILDKGEELALVIDRFTGTADLRSGSGAVGILTGGLIDRQQFFENALEFAFAPFYNPKVYS
jgi:inosine/xanthosine triphosphatase